jgi:hypothetical protein
LLALGAISQEPIEARVPASRFCLDRSGELPICFPEQEELSFRVWIDLGVARPEVGSLTLAVGVEEPRQSMLVLDDSNGSGEEGSPLAPIAFIRANAEGGYLSYHVSQEMTTRHSQTGWPTTFAFMGQTGSESRQRELSIGERDGSLLSVYRSDTHCRGCQDSAHFVESSMPWGKPRHCQKCKKPEHRIWKNARERSVPPGTLDMLSALLLPRVLLTNGLEQTEAMLLDRDNLWRLILRRGSEKRIEVPAGEFDAVAILFETRVPPGEAIEDDEFEGLFGIQGSIHLWVHAETGIILKVEGDVPAGPLRFTASIELDSYKNTPAEFAPAAAK